MALGGKSDLTRPLTKSTKAGQPYTRPPAVETQLVELLRAGTEEQFVRAKNMDKHSSDYLLDECLVYLIEGAGLEDDPEQYQVLVSLLLKRITRSLERKLRTLGVAEDDLPDVHQEVVSAMFRSIHEPTTGEYYQVRFRSALHRQLLKSYDQYARRRRRARREQSLDAPLQNGERENEDAATTFGELLESKEDVAADIEQRMVVAEKRLLVAEALEAISNTNHRKAFVLHYYHGWQVESTDPSAPMLSRLFDRTPRMVRNWLRTAESQVAEWRVRNSVKVQETCT